MTDIKHSGRQIETLSIAGYVAFAMLYFIGPDIHCKIAFTVFWLFICSALMRRWLPALAFLLSSSGDFMGALHKFIPQLSLFALSHIVFIVCFVLIIKGGRQRLKPALKISAAIIFAALMTFAVKHIILNIPQAPIRVAAFIYMVVILTMLTFAIFTRNMSVMAGAILFVASDSILAWNKFVAPIPHSGLFIMLPYYAAELLIFIGLIFRQKRCVR